MLGAFAVACATVLVFVALSAAVGRATIRCELPPIYMLGVWLSILLAIGFIGVYAWQITEECAPARRRAGRDRTGAGARAASLAARRTRRRRRARTRHAALDHLGDRQGTRARDRRRTRRMPTTSGCCASRRSAAATSSAKLTELSADGEPFDRMPLSALIEEVVAPHRNFGVAIDVDTAAGPTPRRSARAIRRSSTASAIWWRTPSISPASASRSRPTGPTTTVAVDDQRRRPGLRAGDHRTGSASPMCAAAASGAMNADAATPASGSASSSPRPCWNAPARRSTFDNRAFPDRGAVVAIRWPRDGFRASPPDSCRSLSPAAANCLG